MGSGGRRSSIDNNNNNNNDTPDGYDYFAICDDYDYTVSAFVALSYNRMLWTALRKKAAYLPG